MTLVLCAIAAVLCAPVVGRMGFEGLANVLVVFAAGCGVASFGVAAAGSFRAQRSTPRSASERSEPPSC